ncbi:MAG: PHP domain-containing protein [Bacillota bacterium]
MPGSEHKPECRTGVETRQFRAYCDLHVHTTASDGSETPEEVVARAVALGLGAIGITDHDTVGGIDSAQKAARGRIVVVPGVEISTEEDDREVHILGYFINPLHPLISAKLRELHRQRRERVTEIVRRLQAQGVSITIGEVEKLAHGVVGRPHIAWILVEKGYASSIDEVFARWIGRGCPAYVPRARFAPAEAVLLIRKAGGAPVLAHPAVTKSEGLIERLKAVGLCGIEVDYPEHSKVQRAHLRGLAEKYGLIPTGGSDYHGPQQRFPLGAALAPLSVIERLRAAAENRSAS